MPDYQLSYIAATHNRLPQLRPALDHLVAMRQPNEEIVVVDGGSTDGTAEYLRQLHAAGQIQQLITEPMQSEAHGLNLGLMAARGQFLKLVRDDVAYDYDGIRQGKDFMLANPEVEVLGANAGTLAVAAPDHFALETDAEENFRRWLNDKQVVSLPGLALLIRREALALTGLLFIGVQQVDTDFTYRLTSLNVNVAWSTAVLALHLVGPATAPALTGRSKLAELDRMTFFHDKTLADKTLSRWWRRSGWATQREPARRQVAIAATGADARRLAEAAMQHYNAEHPAQYLFRVQQLTKAQLQ